eukprot:COSAG02_NODE_8717_length_2461_cov_2.060914_1_plen_220_part_10
MTPTRTRTAPAGLLLHESPRSSLVMWRARRCCLLLDLVLLHTAAHQSKMLPAIAEFEARTQPTAGSTAINSTHDQLAADSAVRSQPYVSTLHQRSSAPTSLHDEDGLPTLFLNEDYSVSALQIQELGREVGRPRSRYSFVWGASPVLMPAWTALPADIRPLLSWYMPYSRDISPVHCRLGSDAQGDCVRGHNISWYLKHRRSWVLWKCDRKTPTSFSVWR